MTQEELDALMEGGDLEMLEEEPEAKEAPETPETEEEEGNHYRAAATHQMPPPLTDDTKMVHQLDDVTKESEEKASEIFDIIEEIGNDMMESEGTLQDAMAVMTSNVTLFETLGVKFPDIVTFREQLEKNERALEQLEAIEALLQKSGDSIMNVMDIMQYQDIHRQKIERVINIMRALSSYMNRLFEGKVEDEKRVSSAVHLPGDQTTEGVVSSEDIEALIDAFGKGQS
jgi:hypothetical protein